MASRDSQYDQLLKLVETLFQSHKTLEAKHEKLEKEVSLLRQQVSAYSSRQNTGSGNVSGLNPTGGATNCDRNVTPTSQKHPASKPGSQSLHTGLTAGATQSPVQLNSDPPTNVQRPYPSQPGRKKPIRFADRCTSGKSPRKLFAHTDVPQETDFINVLRQCGVDINPATIAAVSSASRVQRGVVWTRPVGLYTVFVLDISESMKGQCFNLTKKFIDSLLDGMAATEKDCGLYEYVSLITCGGITAIMQDFTNDYQEVKNKIERLQLGGRTPLMTALTLALCYLELQGENVMLDTYCITPRLIVISDFDITTDKQPFQGTEGDGSEDKTQIQNQALKLGKTQIKPHAFNMIGVSVGNVGMTFAKQFSTSCGGSIISNHADLHNATNYYRHQVAAGCALNEYDLAVDRGNEQDIGGLVKKSMALLHLNDSDENAVMKLVEDQMEDNEDTELVDAVENDAVENDARLSSAQASSIGEPYSHVPPGNIQQVQAQSPPDLPEWQTPRNLEHISLEERFGLPQIGSRVSKGKDWKSTNDDNIGQGTIVGHKEKGIAYVLWDNEQFGEYRHGLDGLYEVQKTDEMRNVAPGQIELGCKIVRGDDWNRGDEDGGLGTVGVVVRKLRGRYVQVRWPIGVIETYRFGADNKWDVKVTDIDPQQELSPYRNTVQPEVSASSNTSWVIPPSHTSQTVPSTNTALTQPSQDQQQNQPNVPLKAWWSFKDSSDQWRIFSDENVAKLEQKQNVGQAYCMLEYKNKRIKVFLDERQCEIDGRRHDIKREMLKQEDIDSLKSVEEFLPALS